MRQAVGFDEARGDTISVVNSAFQPVAAVPTPAAPSFWQNPAFWSIARQVLGAALVLALAWFVLRPMMPVLTRPQPVAVRVGIASSTRRRCNRCSCRAAA